jgi:hypothetical protein
LDGLLSHAHRVWTLTKLTMMKRWNQHVQNAKAKRGKGCAHFWAAIRLYGKDAFSHEVLAICETLEKANPQRSLDVCPHFTGDMRGDTCRKPAVRWFFFGTRDLPRPVGYCALHAKYVHHMWTEITLAEAVIMEVYNS